MWVGNMIFSAGIIFLLLAFNKLLTTYYPRALAWALDDKGAFLVQTVHEIGKLK
jgi:hypothetical protein